MLAFDSLADLSQQIAGYFRTAYVLFEQVPVIGSAVAYPFWYIADRLDTISTWFGWLSLWADTMIGAPVDITQIIADLVGDIWSLIESEPGWLFNLVRSHIEATWSILTATPYQIFDQVRIYIEEAWPAVALNTADLFYSMYDLFQQNWLILNHTPDSLFQYYRENVLDGWLAEKLLDVGGMSLDVVEASMEYLIGVAFTTLDRSWNTFEDSMAWLLDKLLAMMADQAGHFAGGLWRVFEAILAHIEIPEA